MTGSLPSDLRPAGVPDAAQLEAERSLDNEGGDLARAVLAQSQALTTLVSHLTNADPIGDLSSSSSTLSTKGAQGRARLQQELASHRGVFFQSVLQSMARRMQPARVAEQSPQELAMRGVVPTAYLERFGGYGRTRNLGWQVMMIGMLLSLSEAPQAGIFQTRSTTSYAKGRAFAPLAEQRWVTIALAYIKEMDLIATKRMDMTGTKNPEKDGDPSNPPGPNPKKQPKKAPKGAGKQKQGQGQDAE